MDDNTWLLIFFAMIIGSALIFKFIDRHYDAKKYEAKCKYNCKEEDEDVDNP